MLRPDLLRLVLETSAEHLLQHDHTDSNYGYQGKYERDFAHSLQHFCSSPLLATQLSFADNTHDARSNNKNVLCGMQPPSTPLRLCLWLSASNNSTLLTPGWRAWLLARLEHGLAGTYYCTGGRLNCQNEPLFLDNRDFLRVGGLCCQHRNTNGIEPGD